MSNAIIYNREFYRKLMNESYLSAKIVLPIVNELISPGSVCDVGCGTGTWLRAWSDLGVHDVYGLDGDYVDRQQLVISSDQFHPHDLCNALVVDRKFDLAMSLEVAEHLPPERAESFIRG